MKILPFLKQTEDSITNEKRQGPGVKEVEAFISSEVQNVPVKLREVTAKLILYIPNKQSHGKRMKQVSVLTCLFRHLVPTDQSECLCEAQ